MRNELETQPDENSQVNRLETGNDGILRGEGGKLVKGTKSLNPTGRPKNGFRRRLNEMFGPDSSELVLKLAEIAFYDQNTMKDRWAKYKPADVLKATELLLAYQQGKPIQHIEAEIETKTVNVNIQVPGELNI